MYIVTMSSFGAKNSEILCNLLLLLFALFTRDSIICNDGPQQSCFIYDIHVISIVRKVGCKLVIVSKVKYHCFTLLNIQLHLVFFRPLVYIFQVLFRLQVCSWNKLVV